MKIWKVLWLGFLFRVILSPWGGSIEPVQMSNIMKYYVCAYFTIIYTFLEKIIENRQSEIWKSNPRSQNRKYQICRKKLTAAFVKQNIWRKNEEKKKHVQKSENKIREFHRESTIWDLKIEYENSKSKIPYLKKKMQQNIRY